MSPRPQKTFGRRNRPAVDARRAAAPVASAPLPPRAGNLLKETALAVVMVAAIVTGLTMHAASLDDVLAMLQAMTRVEVLAVMAGLMVPWVMLRALAGLPFPSFGRKSPPTIDELVDGYVLEMTNGQPRGDDTKD